MFKLKLIFLLFYQLFQVQLAEKTYILDDTYYSLGHFSLNKTANDTSNYQNHGTLGNISFVEDFMGNPKSAADFSKSDKSLVQIKNHQNYNFGFHNFSIAFWVKSEHVGKNATDSGIILSNRYHNSFRIERKKQTQDIHFVFCEQIHVFKNKIPRVLDGSWHHITIVRDQEYYSTYKDGEMSSVVKISTECNFQSEQDLCIGSLCSGDKPFQGQIRDRQLIGNICKCISPFTVDSGQENCIYQDKPINGSIRDNLILYAKLGEDSTRDISQNYVSLYTAGMKFDDFGGGYFHNTSGSSEISKLEINNYLNYFDFKYNDFTIAFKFFCKPYDPSRIEMNSSSFLFNDKVGSGLNMHRPPYSDYIQLRLGSSVLYTVPNKCAIAWNNIKISRIKNQIFISYVFHDEGIYKSQRYWSRIPYMDLSIAEKLTFGYYTDQISEYKFIGGVADIMIFQEFIPNITYMVWNEIMWFDYLCPFYCLDCYRSQGRQFCYKDSCKGDRIFDGRKCLCPKGSYEDYKSENCVKFRGLISYLSFDSGSNKDIVNDQDLAILGGAEFSEDRFGNKLSAIYFEKSTTQQYDNTTNKNITVCNTCHSRIIQPASQQTYEFLKRDFSISLWVKDVPKVDTPFQYGIIFTNDNHYNLDIYNIVIRRSYSFSDLTIELGKGVLQIPEVFNSQWRHIVFTRYEEKYADVYLDDRLVIKQYDVGISFIQPHIDSIFGGLFRIGPSYESIFRPYSGYMDDFRLYDRKLTQLDIDALFVYPNKPYMCEEFEIVNHEIHCTKCKGNRIFKGNLCDCPEGYFQTMKTEEKCQKDEKLDEDPLILYFPFNGDNQEWSKRNEKPQEFEQHLHPHSLEYGLDRNQINKRALNFTNQKGKMKMVVEQINLLDFMDRDYTVAIWIKGKKTGKKWGSVFYSDPLTNLAIHRQSIHDNLRIIIQSSEFTIQKFFDDSWKHLTLIKYQNDSVSIFINEKKVIGNALIESRNTHTKIQNDQQYNEFILGNNNDNSKPFDGFIDELRVYKKALNIQEIKEILTYKCHPGCQNCKINSQGTQCETCRGDRILNTHNMQCTCPESYFEAPYNQENCKKCPEKCKQCLDENKCVECIDKVGIIQIRIPQQQCECPEKYRDDFPSNAQCAKCPSEMCLTCLTSEKCTTCVNSQRIPQQNCECPSGYFDDIFENSYSCIKCEQKVKFCVKCDQKTGECQKCQGDLQFHQGKCQCGKNLYAIDFDPNQDKCTSCPTEKAHCPGGTKMILKQGYWRQNTTTNNILKCYNQENCKGGFQTNELCKQGYIGPLCEDCDIYNNLNQGKFAKSGKYSCSSCDNIQSNAIKIVLIICIQLGILYFSVDGTIIAIEERIKSYCLKLLFNTGEPQLDEFGIIVKMLYHYLFLIATLLTFRLKMPTSLQNATEGISNPSATMLYSWDCFLNDIQDYIPFIYFRVFYQFFMAIVELLFVYLLSFILVYCKKNTHKFYTFFWTSLIYNFLTLQPVILQMILEVIACRKISGVYYIQSSVQNECKGDTYNNYTYFVMIPILIIWTFLIPLALFLSLKRVAQIRKIKMKSNKRSLVANQGDLQFRNSLVEKFKIQEEIAMKTNLNKSIVLEKYGYLYLEYKDQVYWWEFIKVLERTLVSLVLQFYYEQVYFKGILVFLIVASYTTFQTIMKPYKQQILNDIDLKASGVAGVSIITGLLLYDNYQMIWFVIGILILVFTNLYVILIFGRQIFKETFKIIISKGNQEKQRQHSKQQNQRTAIIKHPSILASEAASNYAPGEKSQIKQTKNTLQHPPTQEQIMNLSSKNPQQSISKQQRKNKEGWWQKLLVNIIVNFLNFAEKYMGHPPQQIINEAKMLRKLLKQHCQIFVLGIQRQLISLHIQEENEKAICTVYEFLSGEISSQKLEKLIEHVNRFQLIQELRHKYVLCELKYHISDMMQEDEIIKMGLSTINQKKNSLRRQRKDITVNIQQYNIQKGQEMHLGSSVVSSAIAIPSQHSKEPEENNKMDQSSQHLTSQLSQSFSQSHSHTHIQEQSIQLNDCEHEERLNKVNVTQSISLIQNLNLNKSLQSQNISTLNTAKNQIGRSEQIQPCQGQDPTPLEKIDSQPDILHLTMMNQPSFTSNSPDMFVDPDFNHSYSNSQQQLQQQKSQHKSNLSNDRYEIDIVLPDSQIKQKTQQSPRYLEDVQMSNSHNFLHHGGSSQTNHKSIFQKLNDRQKTQEETNTFKQLNFATTQRNLFSKDEEINIQILENKARKIMKAVEKQELQENFNTFQLFDLKQKGFITKKCFKKVLKELNLSINQRQFDQLLSFVDTDQNNEVDFCEFQSMMAFKQYQPQPLEEIRLMYQFYNLNTDAFIGRREIKFMIHCLLGKSISQDMAKQLIKQEDRDLDDKLNFQEFINLLI